ncbi:MAG: type II toxin-antitoxin system HicB family antitoxin [Herpetosiphonaceae bacterium]|nr:type II toxin-antitoxin system HicB family antitoxin [Herpetosiphonaceae bacterium]
MNKYTFNVWWSDEDECYVSVCPDFAALSGLGDTAEDALAELQVALALAIETYQQEDWPLPTTTDVNVDRHIVQQLTSFRLRLVGQMQEGQVQP